MYMCYVSAFKKEFQKLGDSFMALAKSFEFDSRPGLSSDLLNLADIVRFMN